MGLLRSRDNFTFTTIFRGILNSSINQNTSFEADIVSGAKDDLREPRKQAGHTLPSLFSPWR